MFPEAVPYIERIEGHVGPAEISSLSRDQVLPGLGGEACGLAVSVGYSGKNTPKARSPLPGLFFVGHDAGGTGYLATHRAVSSGITSPRSCISIGWNGGRSSVCDCPQSLAPSHGRSQKRSFDTRRVRGILSKVRTCPVVLRLSKPIRDEIDRPRRKRRAVCQSI